MTVLKTKLLRPGARARGAGVLSPFPWLVLVILVSTYLGVHSVGLRQIDPTNLRWLSEDPASVFFGSQSYRLATRFSPLAFRTDYFGYPGSVSIALFDPMPIFALVVRVFSPVLPMPLQYDGLYLALCFTLQGIAAFALMRELLGRDRPAAAAMAALLLVMMPPFVTRTYGHVALSSHWLIVAALAIYLRAQRTQTMQWASFLVVIIVAAGINVYISIISLCVVVASGFDTVRQASGRDRIMKAAGVVGLIIVNFLAFNVFGYVTVSDWPILPTNDYGIYSANLLTFISPSVEMSALFRPQAVDPAQQSEGFGYLGLGVLMAAIIAVIRDPVGVGATIKRFAPLVVVGACLFIFATMDQIRFGGTTLVRVWLPHQIQALIASLHANGRFIWLLMYIIPVVAIATLAKHVKARSLLLILVAAVAAQAMEMVPVVGFLGWIHRQQSVEYDAASSIHFAPTVKNFIVLPPWQCGGSPGPQVPGHGMQQATFQSFVSLLNGLRSNSEYMARVPLKTTKPWCDPDAVLHMGALQQDTAYYFSSALYRKVDPTDRSGQWCDVLYDGVLCRPDLSRSGEGEAAKLVREPQAAP